MPRTAAKSIVSAGYVSLPPIDYMDHVNALMREGSSYEHAVDTARRQNSTHYPHVSPNGLGQGMLWAMERELGCYADDEPHNWATDDRGLAVSQYLGTLPDPRWGTIVDAANLFRFGEVKKAKREPWDWALTWARKNTPVLNYSEERRDEYIAAYEGFVRRPGTDDEYYDYEALRHMWDVVIPHTLSAHDQPTNPGDEAIAKWFAENRANLVRAAIREVDFDRNKGRR